MNLLSEAVLSKLQKSVEFENEEDIAQLIADAVNSYVELGQRAQSGTQFFMKTGPDAPLRRMRFPFEHATRSANAAAKEDT